MKVYKFAIIAVITTLFCSVANAASKKIAEPIDSAAIAIPAAMENKIVKYTFSPDILFRIYTLPTLHTHIELGPDEGLKEIPIVGDSAQWSISGGPRNIYVKPLREGLQTTLTLVTNKRSYEFQLISETKKDGRVYQKVSFEFPETELEEKIKLQTEVALVKNEETRLERQIVSRDVDPASLNFNFDVSGSAPFKPISVYADSKKMYIRLPNSNEIPAVFVLENGKPAMINFAIKDNIIEIERIVNQVILTTDHGEIKITQRAPSSKSIWN